MALGCGLQLGYLALWPLSYRLTHGADFTFEYLMRYEWLWLRLYELLKWWDGAVPGIDRSLELNVNLLMGVFALLFGLYLVAAALVYRSRPGNGVAALVVALGLVFQVTLFLMPGLFTTDIFSYAMYGHISGVYQLNPYLQLPGYFPGNPLVDWIHPIWHFAPSVYGPLWVTLSSVISAWVQEWPLVDRILAYKLLINVAHLANVGLAWLLLGRLQPDTRVAGLLLFAWNPLLLFEFAGNGHNDALMLTFLLLAVLLFVERKPSWGLLPLALSVWVKYTTALLVPLYLVIWARQYRSRVAQARVFVGGGLIILLVAALLYLPWFRDGPEILGPIFDWAKGPLYANHPPDVIARQLVRWGLVGHGMDSETALEIARNAAKLITRGLFVLYLGYELLRARKPKDFVPAAVRVFTVFLLTVHTWVLTWYFAWPVALAILLGLRHPLTRLALGFGYTSLVVIYFHQYWDLKMDVGRMLLYVAPLLVPVVEAALKRRSALPSLALSTVPDVQLMPEHRRVGKPKHQPSVGE